MINSIFIMKKYSLSISVGYYKDQMKQHIDMVIGLFLIFLIFTKHTLSHCSSK